ncbi:2-hydroxy-3-oxopropionate reductase [Hydrogenophaga sp. T4]|nr:2-hydroxy-3-oxopropionate reductase [Hydrogenophaga sp. T4]
MVRHPGQVAAQSDIVITMVGYPSDVEQVWLGSEGIIANARNALLIDMTTSSPALAVRLAAEAEKGGHQALDAPVSGGDVGAREARLSIMVGGDPAAYQTALPVLRLLGTNVVHVGAAGAGQHTKMSNQIVIASTIMGVCEGLAYARAAGLDETVLLQAIGGGAAGSFQLNVMGPRIVKGDFAPGFFIEHFLKDLGIALAEAERMKLALPGASLAQRLYTELSERGLSRQARRHCSNTTWLEPEHGIQWRVPSARRATACLGSPQRPRCAAGQHCWLPAARQTF